MWDYYINEVKVGVLLLNKKNPIAIYIIYPMSIFYLSHIMLPHTAELINFMGKNSVYVESKKQAIKNVRKRLIFQYKEYSRMFTFKDN